jgi:signal peptidase II
VVGAVIISLDQLTKWLVLDRLAPAAPAGSVDLVPGILSFVYVENRGAAFGIFQGHSDLVLVAAVLLVTGITIVMYRMSAGSPLLPYATGLIVGGALGNIIDRIRLGFVVDFVAVGPWPKFNVADAAVSVGVALMFVAVLFWQDQPISGTAGTAQDLRQMRDS